MKLLSVTALLLSLSGCAWFAANRSALTADAASAASCVVTEVVEGQYSAANIAIACGLPAAADVLGFVSSLIKSLASAPGTAGSNAASATLLAQLRNVR